MALWVHMRDRISIGPQINLLLAAEANAARIAPGDTLVFLAREIEQSATWQVPDGYKVIIAADRYKTSGNWSAFGAPVPPTLGVDTRGTAGAVGPRGPAGRPGVAIASGGSPGAPGDPGGPGEPGTAGKAITLFAKTLFPVMLNAAGGVGGAGGIGGRGGAGGQGRIVSHANIEIEPTSGGDGGRGGDGGAGGTGGDVSVTYVSPAMVELVTLEGPTLGTDGEQRPAGRSTPIPGSHGSNVPLPIPLEFDPSWVKGGTGGSGGVGACRGPPL